ncbi:DUF4430 domain-containing protein [Gelria sp. Kuro-4]|uniref:DUF4430 domain-containing protein n=1 Tax=Gelria sp. Kuro-4 TaxID=2796927 RepID=UPI001BEF6F18|nr:DUF4430 domain-containing protein [Gelria sp. Kuro-4]BCV23975.1 hypothetical protein kuro4_07480 [Gelria sp. Kuro-4]
MPKALRVLAFIFLVTLLLTPLGCRRGARPAPPAAGVEEVRPAPAATGPASGGTQGENAVRPAPPAPASPGKPGGEAAAAARPAGGTPPKGAAGQSGDRPVPEPVRPARPPAGTAALWITRDFGARVLKSPNVKPVEGEKVLALLGRQAQLETAYGGGFVTKIDGLGGGRPGEDWFYWVNGILAGVGAGDFPARPGDVIWWDFHPWNRTAFLPAVVGAYPEPFVRGYTGKAPAARIVYSAQAAKEAQAAAKALAAAGAPAPELAPYGDASLMKRAAPTLLVATWPEVSGDKDLAGLLKNWRRTGLYFRFDGAGLSPLRADGSEGGRYGPGAGVIAATGSGPGDVSPLWLVLGTDAAGLNRAVALLTQRPGHLARRVGVVVAPTGEVIPLPAVKGP